MHKGFPRSLQNIWWLPDSLERILYFNVISLVLSVMDEVVESTRWVDRGRATECYI